MSADTTGEGGAEDERPETKAAQLQRALDRGRTLIRLDARRPGVRVPEAFEKDHSLSLSLSFRFPDSNIVIGTQGIAATLRFGGRPFRCQIPWFALWGIVPPGAEDILVWPTALPEELGGPVERNDPKDVVVEPRLAKLEVIAANGPKAAAPDEAPSPLSALERAPWLRVVK